MNWTEQDLAEYQKRTGTAPEPGVILTKESKYHNCRVKKDGIWFDSLKESKYYDDLKVQLRAGVIGGFCRQPEFILQEGFGAIKPITYLADFVIFNLNGTAEIIDTKGFSTEIFKIKHKMFKAKFPRLELKIEG